MDIKRFSLREQVYDGIKNKILNKEYKIGDTILEFKKVNPGEIANMSLKTATVIQAIKSLGK